MKKQLYFTLVLIHSSNRFPRHWHDIKNPGANRKAPCELNCEPLETRMMLSYVEIFAAGTTSDEQIDLQIDGATVATFSELGDGANSRNFNSFVYDSGGSPIAADRIRIAFTNDLYQPENNIDRNVRIDKIVIDGQTFETEDASVFSTGTWNNADGITLGFRESEFLHANGYLQFAGDLPTTEPGQVVINKIHYNPGPDGEVDGDAEFIELYNPGGEAVDLSGMSFVGFDLTFDSGTTLGAGQYAIVSPSISIAQNQWGVTPIAQFADGGISGGGETIQLLAVDGETVDRVDYDDASPCATSPDGDGFTLSLINSASNNNVASSWLASTQINGTSGAANNLSPSETTSISIFAAGSTANEIVQLEIAGVIVASYQLSEFGGNAGDFSSRDFTELTYVSETAFAAADVRINFVNDVYDPAAGIDYNVRIDRIEIDSVVFETEAPTTFLAGTWIDGQGISEGFLQKDRLNANGYFQYDA